MKHGILSLFTMAALLACLSFCGTTAQAQSPLYGAGYGGCGLGGLGFNSYNYTYSNLYGTGQLFVPPYFSVHPPVYYSEPVARPYGYSPFALPPGVMPAEMLAASQPLEIINPYVEEEEVEAKETSAQGKIAAAPQWILNPFVDQITELADLPVVE